MAALGDATTGRDGRPRRLGPPAAAIGLSAAVFAGIADRVARGKSVGFDAPLTRLVDAIGPVLGLGLSAHALLKGGALLGGAAAVGGILYLVAHRRVREVAFLALSVGGMLALDPILKDVFQRPPVSADGSGYAFPSGTAMVSAALLASVVLLVPGRVPRWTLTAAGAALAAGLGVAVVYLKWHYPSDVVAGWCLAAAWVGALWLVLLRRARGS